VLLKEIAAGAMMGVVCGVATGLVAVVFIRHTPDASHALSATYLATIVAISLACAMSFAAIFGAAVPLLLHRVRIDPAVASGPFVTITNDVFALLIYFVITSILVRQGL
jgi:magnesium transporter